MLASWSSRVRRQRPGRQVPDPHATPGALDRPRPVGRHGQGWLDREVGHHGAHPLATDHVPDLRAPRHEDQGRPTVAAQHRQRPRADLDRVVEGAGRQVPHPQALGRRLPPHHEPPVGCDGHGAVPLAGPQPLVVLEAADEASRGRAGHQHHAPIRPRRRPGPRRGSAPPRSAPIRGRRTGPEAFRARRPTSGPSRPGHRRRAPAHRHARPGRGRGGRRRRAATVRPVRTSRTRTRPASLSSRRGRSGHRGRVRASGLAARASTVCSRGGRRARPARRLRPTRASRAARATSGADGPAPAPRRAARGRR